MASSAELVSAKRKIADNLLSVRGVSGVGLRDDRVVVYLDSDDTEREREAREIIKTVSPSTPVAFEVTGTFRKE